MFAIGVCVQPAQKRFVSVPGAGHNDLGARAVAAAKEFVAEQ